jgi:hypothetical protein
MSYPHLVSCKQIQDNWCTTTQGHLRAAVSHNNKKGKTHAQLFLSKILDKKIGNRFALCRSPVRILTMFHLVFSKGGGVEVDHLGNWEVCGKSLWSSQYGCWGPIVDCFEHIWHL